ncbi:endonuclease/exonuclease/phosphatase family protein [Bacillus sp. AK128]
MMELTAMSFNLRLHVPNDGENSWPYRVDRVITLIKEMNPAIIGTQEVLPIMMEDLEKGLPSYRSLGEGRDKEDSQFNEYCPIYYSVEVVHLLESGTFWLSEQPDEKGSISWNAKHPRICSWGLFESKDDSKTMFYVFNVHLDHISREARDNGIKVVKEEIRKKLEQTKAAVIIMGDFNAYPDEECVVALKQNFVDAYTFVSSGSYGCTFHNFEGVTEGQPIDYIFVTKDITIQETEIIRNQIQDGYPSDHYPVVTKLTL